jgi:hypothetical protein
MFLHRRIRNILFFSYHSELIRDSPHHYIVQLSKKLSFDIVGARGAETAIERCCIVGPIQYRGHKNDTLPSAQEVFATAMPHKSWLRLYAYTGRFQVPIIKSSRRQTCSFFSTFSSSLGLQPFYHLFNLTKSPLNCHHLYNSVKLYPRYFSLPYIFYMFADK